MLVAAMAPGLTSGVHLGPAERLLRELDRDDRVEAHAGRVDADRVRDRVGARLLHDLGHREDLGDRLDRDRGLHVARGVDLAVRGHEGDAVDVRVDLGERRDVVGVLAFLEVLVLRVGRVERAPGSRPGVCACAAGAARPSTATATARSRRPSRTVLRPFITCLPTTA